MPNRIARSLASGRTGNIGFFVHDIGNPISPPSIKAFQAEARRADLTPLLVDRLDGTADDSAVIHAVAQQVDGLVLGQPRMTDEDLLDLAETLPIVLINRILRGVPTVAASAGEAMADVVDHLTDLGHRRLAFLGSSDPTPPARQRGEAFLAETSRARIRGIELPPREPQFSGGVAAVSALLQSDATAVVAHNDLMALGLLRELSAAGVVVGRDLSLVGYDDIWVTESVHPTLTTVRLPIAEITSLATRILLDLVSHSVEPAAETIRIPCRLVVRESTGPVNRRNVER